MSERDQQAGKAAIGVQSFQMQVLGSDGPFWQRHGALTDLGEGERQKDCVEPDRGDGRKRVHR